MVERKGWTVMVWITLCIVRNNFIMLYIVQSLKKHIRPSHYFSTVQERTASSNFLLIAQELLLHTQNQTHLVVSHPANIEFHISDPSSVSIVKVWPCPSLCPFK